MASGSTGKQKTKNIKEWKEKKTAAGKRNPFKSKYTPVPNANGDGGFDGAPF